MPSQKLRRFQMPPDVERCVVGGREAIELWRGDSAGTGRDLWEKRKEGQELRGEGMCTVSDSDMGTGSTELCKISQNGLT